MFMKGVLFSLLVISVKLVHCGGSTRFAQQCFGWGVYDTLQRTASTVQSYLAIERNINESQFQIPGAEPRQIWMLIREGTRTPTEEKVAELKELEDLRDEIVENFETSDSYLFCESDWKKLREWKWNENITNNQEQVLTSRGQNEIRFISRNYKRYFPELFDDIYSPVAFNFTHTESDGTRETFNTFVDEMFGYNAHMKIEAEPTDETEKLLEPFKECAAFTEQQESLDESDSEVSKFQDAKLFQNVIKEVSRRLHFRKKLKKKDLMNMYDMCRYEQAWRKNATSVWCLMFTPKEIKVLEYAKDLSDYYEYGYGSELNRYIQCSSVRDMVSHLEFSRDPRVTVYFGQSSTLLLHLTAMGAFKDEQPLTATNFQKMPERKWSTSKMSPFAGNFAAVRYSTKQVKFFLNEELIYFDWCKHGICHLADVRRKYRELDSCETTFCPSEDDSESLFSLLLKSFL